MRLKDEKNILSAREIINALQTYILERIDEEKDNFFKARRLLQNTKKLTKMKMLENWKKKLNISDREFLLMIAFNQNLNNLSLESSTKNADKNFYNVKKEDFINNNSNFNVLHNSELEKEIISSRISFCLSKKLVERNRSLEIKNEELKKELINLNNKENELLERIKLLSK
jgi:hypothetical protein